MSKKNRTLVVLLNGRHVGSVEQTDNAQLEFQYEEKWRRSPKALPLSLSMPLAKRVHGHEAISAFMWGLLPDNEVTLNEWGKRHHVSPRNCFALLGAVGQDCPGAIQFAFPNALDELEERADPEWLEEEELEKIISDLVKNPGAGRPAARESGQFSLAGAQSKTALYFDGERWGIPKGRTPTTHILKPAVGDLEGQVQNEHFCLQLARRVEIPSVMTEILMIGDIPVISSTRYDRQKNKKGQIVRVHQEDMCQALAVNSSKKYENEGGPSIIQIMKLLGDSSSRSEEDRDRFMRAQAFNFIIAGTDAHAKNYSLVLAPGKQVRLAPLYDVASFLPYADTLKKVKMAMKIGSKYQIEAVQPRHWESLSQDANYDAERMIAHIRNLLIEIPGHSLAIYDACKKTDAPMTVLDPLINAIWQRCKDLVRVYGAE